MLESVKELEKRLAAEAARKRRELAKIEDQLKAVERVLANEQQLELDGLVTKG